MLTTTITKKSKLQQLRVHSKASRPRADGRKLDALLGLVPARAGEGAVSVVFPVFNARLCMCVPVHVRVRARGCLCVCVCGFVMRR